MTTQGTDWRGLAAQWEAARRELESGRMEAARDLVGEALGFRPPFLPLPGPTEVLGEDSTSEILQARLTSLGLDRCEELAYRLGLKPVLYLTAAEPLQVETFVDRYRGHHIEILRAPAGGSLGRGVDVEVAHLFVGHEARDCRWFADVYREGDPSCEIERLGQLMGYPPCCVKAFAGLDDRSHDSANVAAAIARTPGRADPLLNLPQVFLVPFFPCRLDCGRALAFARAVFEALTDEGEGRRALLARLSRPTFFFDREHSLALGGGGEDGTVTDPRSELVIHSHRAVADRTLLNLVLAPLLSGASALEVANGRWTAASQLGEVSLLRVESDRRRLVAFRTAGADDTSTRAGRVAFLVFQSSGRGSFLHDDDVSLASGLVRQAGVHSRVIEVVLDENGDNEDLLAAVADHLVAEMVEIVVVSRVWSDSVVVDLRRVLTERAATPPVLVRWSADAPEVPEPPWDLACGWASADTIVELARRPSPRESARIPGLVRAGAQISPEVSGGTVECPDRWTSRPDFRRTRFGRRQVRGTHLVVYGNPGCPYRRPLASQDQWRGIDLASIRGWRGCSFCEMPSSEPHRRIPDIAEHVAAQLAAIQRHDHGTDQIILLDQDPIYYLPTLFNLANKSRLKRFHLLIQSRADLFLVHREAFEQALELAERGGHGLTPFLVGIENFHQPTLDLFNKGLTAEVNAQVLDYLRGAHSRYPTVLDPALMSFGFILWHPWVTVDELLVNLDAMDRLGLGQFRGELSRSKLRLYPQLPLFARALREGLVEQRYEGLGHDSSARYGYRGEIPYRIADPRCRLAFAMLAELEGSHHYTSADLRSVLEWISMLSAVDVDAGEAARRYQGERMVNRRPGANVHRGNSRGSQNNSRASFDPEWLALEARLKPALRTALHPSSAEGLESRAKAAGLAVVRAQRLVELGGEPSLVLYVAPSAALALELRDVEHPVLPGSAERLSVAECAHRHQLLGHLLGFPGCCVAAFVERLQRGVHSRVDGTQAHEDFVACESAIHQSRRCLGRLNTLHPNRTLRLVSFYPCRFNCPEAASFAAALFKVAYGEHPDDAIWLREQLLGRFAIDPQGRRSRGTDRSVGSGLTVEFSVF